MLEINDLHAAVKEKPILKGVHLKINRGQVHAIMGPNGAGKSTLSAVLAGKSAYNVTQGSVWFDGKDLLSLSAQERAALGLFVAFQYPVEIPGVSTTYFLKTALNAIRKQKGLDPMDAVAFMALIKEKMQLMGMDERLTQRAVNEGFSGGEKKRSEMLQMAVLNPSLCILDETDSGLDVDALKAVANGINQFRNSQNAIVLITHYEKLLDYVVPDYTHVFYDGKIIQSGNNLLAKKLMQQGYEKIVAHSI